ncbi:MAG: phage tail protein [Edwardsiella tarda]
MSAKYFAILTNLGAAKMANATALGTKLNLTHMAVGDGGGTLQTPNPAQTALRGERRRAALNMLSVDPNNTSAIIAEQVIPESEGGWWVREIGLYDSDGVLIAIANCPETYKPLLQEGSGRTQTIRMVLTVSSTEAVTLKIDPAVVLATRQYVDDHVIEVRNYIDSQLEAHARSRNHPDATLSAKGFVQLSSDDNSAAENKAATPASVKKVRDLALTKAPLNSPSFTGRPTTPTPALSARGLEMANAEFVAAKVAALVGSAPGVLDTLQEIAAALNNNPNFANEIINQLAGKQPLDSTLTALSGKSIDGLIRYLGLTGTIDLAAGALQKAQNGVDIPDKERFVKTIGACRAFHGSLSTGAGNWTTEQFINWLESQGAFNHPYWMCKCSWSYGNNRLITDTDCGNIHLSGAVIEVMGIRSAMTIRVTTPTTSSGGAVANAQYTYINHGDTYLPGWRRDYNTKNPQPAFALGQTGVRVDDVNSVPWDAPSGVYDAKIYGASNMILHFYMGTGSCPAVQFKINYRNGGVAYRSARDGKGFESGWVELMPATKTVQDIRLSTKESAWLWNGPGYNDQPPYVITGVGNDNRDEYPDQIYRRALQKFINGTWYNVGGL